MSKKIILVLFCAILFLGARFASASLVINEIMYDPSGTDSGREWVEVYNTDSTLSVDLSKWYFFTDNTKHSLSPQGSPTLPADDYAVIVQDPVKFATDWPNFSGLIFDSSWSDLNNTTGETVALKDPDLNLISETPYYSSQGGQDDSNSLQKISGSWVGAAPTPGAINQSTPPPDDNNENSNPPPTGGGTTSTTTTTTPPEPKPKVIENPTIKAKIIANTLAFTGEPLEMQTKILGYSNENVVLGRAYWNFGDGGSLMQVNNFEKFSHTYYYPGEYIVFLEYYSNSFSKTPEATSKMIIKVLPTTVTISKVGDAKDFFIELTNNASSDIDISNWVVNASGKIFILPKNSVIMSKKQMTISGKITGFVYGDQYNLKLLSGTGELVSDYNIPLASTKILAIKPSSEIKSLAENNPKNSTTPALPEPSTELSPSDQVPIESLSANALEGTSSNKSYFFFWGLVVLLVASGGAVYYIRQGKNVSKVGDDFKIIDE